MYDETNDKELLLNTVQKFMEDEMYPHEEKVDKLGFNIFLSGRTVHICHC